MTQQQRTDATVSLVFFMIAIVVAIVGLFHSGCASWQSVARQAAFSASAAAKLASEEMPRLLSAQCVKDTAACHRRESCLALKASGSDDVASCCPEIALCRERAEKAQLALSAVNQAVLVVLRLVESSERASADEAAKVLAGAVSNLSSIQEGLK